MAVLPGEKTDLSVGGAVVRVVSISGPSVERPEVDITNLDSTAKEFRFGLKDGGECTFDVYYDSASHSALLGKIDDTTASTCSIVHKAADGSADGTVSFDAYVMGYEFSGMEVEGNVTASVTLKVTGDVTIT